MIRATLILALAALPAAALAQSPSPAAHEPPYAALAKVLDTPDLVASEGPKDKSLLKLRFVGDGETEARWKKMTSISIAKVKAGDTETAAHSVIAKFKASLEAHKHAVIKTFEESASKPTTAYFEFVSTDGIAEQGIAYSPADGFVSVIQVAYKHGYVHGATDRDVLKKSSLRRSDGFSLKRVDRFERFDTMT